MSGINPDSEFEAFAKASDVQVGDTNLASQGNAEPQRTEPPKTKPAPAAKTAPADDAGEGDDGDTGGDTGDDDLDLGRVGDEDDGEGDDGEGDDGEGDDDGDRRRETPESRTKRLQRERAAARQEVRELKARLAQTDVAAIEERILARLQNGDLPARQVADNAVDKLGAAPDPLDQDKYPLGHLDAQYIEDRTDWLAEKKLAERSDAALHRQQEEQQQQARQAEQERIASTVKSTLDKGSAIYDDFEEVTMKTKWQLSKTAFDAASDPDIEHGARILYNLAKNPAEAEKLFKMSDVQQIRYIDRKNAEIDEKIKARKIPRAGTPPQTKTRGGNSRVSINPATDNLDDFEKLVKQDAKRNSR